MQGAIQVLGCSLSLPLLTRLKISAMFLRRLVAWPSIDVHVKFYGDRPRGPLHRGRG